MVICQTTIRKENFKITLGFCLKHLGGCSSLYLGEENLREAGDLGQSIKRSSLTRPRRKLCEDSRFTAGLMSPGFSPDWV